VSKQSLSHIFKCNLLVLLALYPIVYLWGYFISGPLIDARGVPFWLSLFIGNIVSTQLLGWWVMPMTFKRFKWWLDPQAPISQHIFGYALIGTFYIVAMVGYALLLHWAWGKV